MKILVLKTPLNRPIGRDLDVFRSWVLTYIQKVIDFNPFTRVDFEVKDYRQDVELKLYSRMGLQKRYSVKNLEKIVEPYLDTYDKIFFIHDITGVKVTTISRPQFIENTLVMEICSRKDIDLANTLSHEFIHGLFGLSLRSGMPLEDTMDRYDLDGDMWSLKGNRARNIRELEPFLRTLMPVKPPQKIVIHNTAVKRTNAKQFRGVNNYHREKGYPLSSLGWYAGYNEFVDIDGTRTKTREWGEETMAQVGHNCDIEARCDSYSVCFALDGSTQTLNNAQIKTWREIRRVYPNAEITLHRDIQENRTCPGKLITSDYLENILTDEPLTNEDEWKRKNIAEQIKLIDTIVGLLVKLVKRET